LTLLGFLNDLDVYPITLENKVRKEINIFIYFLILRFTCGHTRGEGERRREYYHDIDNIWAGEIN
jgi:hypothetical protein